MSGLSDLVEDFPEPMGKRGGRRLRSSHCPHGHEYTPENTAWSINKAGYRIRTCRVCHGAKTRRWKLRVGYKYKPPKRSRIARARELLRLAVGLVPRELAGEIQSFLAEGER